MDFNKVKKNIETEKNRNAVPTASATPEENAIRNKIKMAGLNVPLSVEYDPNIVAQGKEMYEADNPNRNKYTFKDAIADSPIGAAYHSIFGKKDATVGELNESQLNEFYARYTKDADDAMKYSAWARAQNDATSRENELKDLGLVRDDLLKDKKKSEEISGNISKTIASLGSAPLSVYDAGKMLGEYVTNKGEFSEATKAGLNTPFVSMKQQFQADVIGNINKNTEGTWADFSDDNFLKWGLGIDNMASWLYSMGYSAAESTVLMGTMGPVGTIMLGTSAGASATLEALQEGKDSNKALATGIINGTVEWATERFITLEWVLKSKNLSKLEGKELVKTWLVNELKSAGAEGSEEFASGVIDYIADGLINQDDSEFAKAKAEFLAAGYNDKDATIKAITSKIPEIVSDTLSGALSGALMSGVGGAVQNASINSGYARSIAESQRNGTYQDLLNNINAVEGTSGNLTTDSKTRDVIRDYRRGTENMSVAAIKEQLESKGVLTNISEKTAQAIFDKANDFALSSEQKRLLKTAEAQRVLNEFSEGKAEWVQTTQAAQDAFASPIESKYKGETENGSQTAVEDNTASEKVAEYKAKANVETDTEVSGEEILASSAKALGLTNEEVTAGYNVRSDVTPQIYANALELSKAYGRAGMSLADLAKKGVAVDQLMSKVYNESNREYVKNLKDNRKRINASNKSTKYMTSEEATNAGVNAVDMDSLTTEKKNALDSWGEFINKVFGLDVHYFDGVGTDKNGWYNDNGIFIDINATNGVRVGDIKGTTAHELTHSIKDASPELYLELRKFITDYYFSKDENRLNREVESKINSYKNHGIELDEETAIEEIIADSCAKIFDDENAIRKMANQNKSLAQKIVDWLNGIINKIKSLVSSGRSNEYAEFLDADALEKVRDIFAKFAREIQSQLEEVTESIPEVSTEATTVEDMAKFSLKSYAEAIGFNVEKDADAGSYVWTRGLATIQEATDDMIVKSPVGAMILYSKEQGYITDEEYASEIKLFKDVANMCIKQNDFSQAMQFVGSSVFTAMKKNADKQYNTTYDFPSICTKTQAVIDTMSSVMMEKGRGLDKSEIEQIYKKVWDLGNAVPCPECYVFSRWVGISGLLDNIKTYQERYKNKPFAQVQQEYREMKNHLEEFAKEAGLTVGKAKSKLATKLSDKYTTLKEKIEKTREGGGEPTAKELADLKSLESEIDNIGACSWLEKVYFADVAHTKKNLNFEVPDDVLFNLNAGERFATEYKAAWGFRTTQGAGYGKAITPYAEAVLGEGILVTNNAGKVIKEKGYNESGARPTNQFLEAKEGVLSDNAKSILERARKRQLSQAFIGGQRFQSTSDARYENATDYLIAALEMQAMHGMVQVYTKVSGAVSAFANWGFSINQSLMPKSGGIDANGKILDTSTGGMNPAVAFENRAKFESAGTITIGVNDRHIRALFADKNRDFIIPYHASGGDKDLIAAFRKTQDKDLTTVARSTDYSKEQGEKILEDDLLETMGYDVKDVHKFREQRLAILTGKGTIDMDYVNAPGNEMLQTLFNRLNSGTFKGATIAKGVCESQIFPNEYWNTSVDLDGVSQVVEDYLEYCRRLGMLHKFSGQTQVWNKKTESHELKGIKGYDENGNEMMLTDLAYKPNSTEVEEGYFKVLIDRRMYDNNGKYLPQKFVSLGKTVSADIGTFARYNKGSAREYDANRSAETAKKIAEEFKGDKFSFREYFNDEQFQKVASEEPLIATLQETISKANGTFPVSVYRNFFKENPNMDFVVRFQNGDKSATEELEKILNKINDAKVLEDLRWYSVEAHGNIPVYITRSDGSQVLWEYASFKKKNTKGIKKYRQMIDDRIQKVGDVGGAKLNIANNTHYTADEVIDLFNKLNHNKDYDELSKKVFERIKTLNLAFVFTDAGSDAAKTGRSYNQGYYSGNYSYHSGKTGLIVYRTNSFNDARIGDERKANILLHECIHACTSYVTEGMSLMPSAPWSNDLQQARGVLGELYRKLSWNTGTKAMYGLMNSEEFISEISNPKFREYLNKLDSFIKLDAEDYVDFLEAQGYLVGINPNEKIGSALACILDKFLDNFDEQQYRNFAIQRYFRESSATPKYSVKQEYSSEDTSLNQTPSTFTNYKFRPTDRILDWGGGRYDAAKTAMESVYPGITFEVDDAFNRTPEHNARIEKEFSENPATVLTINNVLNVIKEKSIREDVLRESKKYLAPYGMAYILIHPGTPEQQALGGEGVETSKGWQNAKKASWYLDSVKKFYKNVQVKGDMILASDGEIRAWKMDAETKAKMDAAKVESKSKKLDMKYSKYSVKELNPPTRKSGSMFSGGGLIEQGLGYELLDKQFGVEYNSKIAAVYRNNYGHQIFAGEDNGDVIKFNSDRVKDLWALHCSPVCHDFSNQKQRRKITPEELKLDMDAAKAVARHIKAGNEGDLKVFTLENAPGYKNSEMLKVITDQLDNMGWKWDVDVYNSADYGSATSRRRCLLRAVKDGELPAKPQKIGTDKTWDSVTRDLWDSFRVMPFAPSQLDAIANTPGLDVRNNDKAILCLGTTNGHQMVWAEEGELSPTLTTKISDARLVLPGGKVVKPSVQFFGRIMGMPDSYKYPTKAARNETVGYTIVGNGVPVELTKAVIGGLYESKYNQETGKQMYSLKEEALQPISDADYEKMKKHFGVTNNIKVAGYLLKDGKMLDFSGKHWGDTTSRDRQVDHRDINEVLPDGGTNYGAMVRMIANGNIRLMPESGGICLSQQPTEKQREILGYYIRMFSKYDRDSEGIIVDFDEPGGDTVYSKSYRKGVDTRTVLRDIDNYFKNGKPSMVAEFHNSYSIKGNGYDGYSMSNNARAAYGNGEMPLSKWTKQTLLEGISDINPDIDCSAINVETLRERMLSYSSWHHTSMYYNETKFYTLREEMIKNLTQDDVDEIALNQKHTKVAQRDRTYDEEIDDIYRKALIMKEAGLFKTEAGAMKSITNRERFESNYLKAVDTIYKRDRAKVEQWRKNPYESIQERAKEYEKGAENWIEYFYSKMPKLNRNTNDYKLLLRRVQLYHNANDNSYSLKSEIDPRMYLATALLDNIRNEEDRKTLEEYKATYNERKALYRQLDGLKADLDEASNPEELKAEMSKVRKKIRTLEDKLNSVMTMPRMQSIIKEQREDIERYKWALLEQGEKAEKERARLEKKLGTYADEIRRRMEKEKQMRSDFKEQRGVAYYRPRVEKLVKELTLNLKKTPEIFRKPFKGFLESLDTSNPKISEALAKLNVADLDAQTWYDKYGIDLDPELVNWVQQAKDMLDTAVFNLGNINVAESNSETLKLLHKMLRSLNTTAKMLTRAYTNHALNMTDLAKQTDDFLRTIPRADTKVPGAVKFLTWSNAQPVTVFDRFGDAGRTIMGMLKKGQSKAAFNDQLIEDFIEQNWTIKQAAKWSNDTVEVELSTGKVTMTVAQMMTFINLANDTDGLRHLTEGGGFKLAELHNGKRVLTDDARRIETEDVLAISEALNKYDPKALEVARAIQKFMEVQGSAWGNEVSIQRYGYEQFGIENYFPLHTVAADKVGNVTVQQEGNASFFGMLNRSFTKERSFRANNALVVDNIFDVFAEHMSQMSMYNAFALPVLDVDRWMRWEVNTKDATGRPKLDTLGSSMDAAFGKNVAQEYVRNLLRSLNGERMEEEQRWALQGLRLRNRVAVAANIRVAVQQPFSIVRAFDVIAPKYFSVPSDFKSTYNEMIQNSGIALWKKQGHYDVNIKGTLLNQVRGTGSAYGDFVDNLTEKTMSLAEMGDNFTWTLLWQTSKNKAIAEDKGASNEEILKKTNEIFEDIIYRTQVVDTPLTKSNWMRGKDFFRRSTSAFKSEPTTTYNMLLRQADRLMEAKRSGANVWQTVKGPMTRAVTVFAMQALVNALVTSIVDAMRDDDDYETLMEKFKQAFVGEGGFKELMKSNVGDNAVPLTSLPFLSDIYSLVSGYTPDRADLTIYQSIMDIAKKISSAISTGNWDYKATTKLFDAASQVSGIPFNNMMRDIESVWNTTVGRMYPEYKLQRTPELASAGYKALYKAMTDGNSVRVSEIIDELASNNISDKTAYTGVTTQIRNAYRDGKISSDDAIEYMMLINGYFEQEKDRKHIEKQVAGW